ncbi:hypothetical protein ACIOHE_28560 [Streptomyces sp. NPDC087851]|uniref:hypothetical protein n=1 Tax=Streptomyces sp. NPDC087851 TaxID=3365810 RepID=UPI0037F28A16
MQCPVCGAGTEEFRGEQGVRGERGVPDEYGVAGERGVPGEYGVPDEYGVQGEYGVPGGQRGPIGPGGPGRPDEYDVIRAYEPPPPDDDLWESRTMMPGGAPGPGGPSPAVPSAASAPRKRLLITVAVVALGCLGAAVAVVGTSGGGGAGRGPSADGQPSRIGSPELPGLGGVVTPSPGDGDGGAEGAGAAGGGGGQAGGAAAGPGPSAPPAPPAPSDSPSAPGHGPGAGEWAGPGCTTGTYREHGRFENGKAAWYTVKTGGYKGDSCDGRFSAVPMSGSPNVDRGSTAVWSWKLDAPYKKCALAIYVPDSGDDADAAGDPTVYQVLADPADGTSGYAAFGVGQTVHRGSLVQVGSYPVKGKAFSVRLVDRGQDWGSQERFGAHHAAAQMRVECA